MLYLAWLLCYTTFCLSVLPTCSRRRQCLQSQPGQVLLELDASLEGHVVGRVSDQDLELASLGLPVVSAIVPELEGVLVQLDCDRLLLSGLESNLFKGLQLLDRSAEAALDVADVDLSDLPSGNLARVLDLERDFEIPLGRDGRGGDVGKVKGGVGETVSEGEEGLGLRLFKVSVADKNVFLVVRLAIRRRGDSESDIGGRVGQSFTTDNGAGQWSVYGAIM